MADLDVYTTPIIDIKERQATKRETPMEKFPPGFKFKMIQWDGEIIDIEIKRYNASDGTFTIERPLGEMFIQDKLPLKQVEAMNAPELDRYPIGTNVNIQRKSGEKVTGKIAGYAKEIGKYVVWFDENQNNSAINNISTGYKTVSPQVLNTDNFRGEIKKVVNE